MCLAEAPVGSKSPWSCHPGSHSAMVEQTVGVSTDIEAIPHKSGISRRQGESTSPLSWHLETRFGGSKVNDLDPGAPSDQVPTGNILPAAGRRATRPPLTTSLRKSEVQEEPQQAGPSGRQEGVRYLRIVKDSDPHIVSRLAHECLVLQGHVVLTALGPQNCWKALRLVSRIHRKCLYSQHGWVSLQVSREKRWCNTCGYTRSKGLIRVLRLELHKDQQHLDRLKHWHPVRCKTLQLWSSGSESRRPYVEVAREVREVVAAYGMARVCLNSVSDCEVVIHMLAVLSRSRRLEDQRYYALVLYPPDSAGSSSSPGVTVYITSV